MENFLEYIDQSVLALQQEEKELIASDRKDEANFVRIRSNVYGIAKAYYGAVQKAAPEEFKDEYTRRITKLLGTWQDACDKATAHEDVEKTVVEEVKLQTLKEILQHFDEKGNSNL